MKEDLYEMQSPQHPESDHRLLTFLIMVTVNILANTLPINGVTSAEVSDSYPNLFAPAGLTFAIWGLIYLLLALYTLYHLGLFSGKGTRSISSSSAGSVSIFLCLPSPMPCGFFLAWADHPGITGPDRDYAVLSDPHQSADQAERSEQQRKLPDQTAVCRLFRLDYRGTIANATVLLVSLGWDGFGIPETVWTVVVLGVGLLVGAASTIRFQSVAYGLVLIWAYTGILIKHLSPGGFSGQYPAVVIAAIIAIAGFIAALLVVLFGRKRDPSNDNR
jgi:hypothetical protein